MSQNPTGFNVFLTSLYNQIYNATGVSKGMEEIQRLAEERWQTMTAAEKKKYIDFAEQNRPQQLGLEMPAAGGVTISTAESSSGRKRKRQNKHEKDPNQPKRAITAFFFFALEERPKVKEAHPEFKVTEISKELGRMWAAMTDEQKDKFLKKAEEDKLRYAKEKEVYEKSKQTATVTVAAAVQEVSAEEDD